MEERVEEEEVPPDRRPRRAPSRSLAIAAVQEQAVRLAAVQARAASARRTNGGVAPLVSMLRSASASRGGRGDDRGRRSIASARARRSPSSGSDPAGAARGTGAPFAARRRPSPRRRSREGAREAEHGPRLPPRPGGVGGVAVDRRALDNRPVVGDANRVNRRAVRPTNASMLAATCDRATGARRFVPFALRPPEQDEVGSVSTITRPRYSGSSSEPITWIRPEGGRAGRATEPRGAPAPARTGSPVAGTRGSRSARRGSRVVRRRLVGARLEQVR